MSRTNFNQPLQDLQDYRVSREIEEKKKNRARFHLSVGQICRRVDLYQGEELI